MEGSGLLNSVRGRENVSRGVDLPTRILKIFCRHVFIAVLIIFVLYSLDRNTKG